MVVIFNLQTSHLLNLSLPTEDVSQVNGQNRRAANLPVVDFHSKPREMPTPTPLNSYLSVFLLCIGFLSLLGKLEPHCLSAIQIFLKCFRRHNSRSSKKVLILRIVKALLFIHQPDRVALKASDVSAADWLYQHTFFTCVVTAFLRARNPRITSQFM